MPKIKSSMITWVEYDPVEQELDVTFTSGAVHVYFGVSQDIYDQFLNAPSQGKFFNQNIKEEYKNKKRK